MKDELSVMAHLELVVPDGQGEDLLKAADGDAWECGPFVVRRGSHCCTHAIPPMPRYLTHGNHCVSQKMCQPVHVQRAVAPDPCTRVCSVAANWEASAARGPVMSRSRVRASAD